MYEYISLGCVDAVGDEDMMEMRGWNMMKMKVSGPGKKYLGGRELRP